MDDDQAREGFRRAHAARAATGEEARGADLGDSRNHQRQVVDVRVRAHGGDGDDESRKGRPPSGGQAQGYVGGSRSKHQIFGVARVDVFARFAPAHRRRAQGEHLRVPRPRRFKHSILCVENCVRFGDEAHAHRHHGALDERHGQGGSTLQGRTRVERDSHLHERALRLGDGLCVVSFRPRGSHSCPVLVSRRAHR